jgi:hypothetical protein
MRVEVVMHEFVRFLFVHNHCGNGELSKDQNSHGYVKSVSSFSLSSIGGIVR